MILKNSLFHEVLEEMNDMCLIRDVTDDLQEFKNFLQEKHLTEKMSSRKAKYLSKIDKLTSSIEKDAEIIQNATAAKKREIGPGFFWRHGYFLVEFLARVRHLAVSTKLFSLRLFSKTQSSKRQFNPTAWTTTVLLKTKILF